MTPKRTPGDVAVQPRDIRFKVDDAREGHWLGGDPVGTAVFNALSLTFPDGERLFIDAVRHFRPRLSGKLAEDVKGFIAQEAIHSREHHALNQLIDRSRYPVDEIESRIRERIAFARGRGPYGMLISTIALEHFTAMMADMHVRHQDLFDNVSPDIERMWRWHALEELEHKAVAYDVYMEVTRDWPPIRRYLRRTVAMALIGYYFTRNITFYAARLLEADGYEPKAALKAVRRFVWSKPGIFRRGWKTFLAWFRPGFHPWDKDNRALSAAWRAEFDAAASTPA
ncbi:MAG: metal-dependent hydrolase [Hyphomonadaceae bacterium]|nr:metal-dependent hydrolase [Hyphomonadaceae bacterium]